MGKCECQDCKDLKVYFEGEDYSDWPQWADFINRWNKAYDVLGRWCLWVLRIDMGHTKALTNLHPDKYSTLLQRLRSKYAELHKLDKLPNKEEGTK